MNTQFDNTIIEMIENASRNTQLKPVYLNGPGGTVGQLPQEKVKYDTAEAELEGFISASGSPSIIDNLNHIRYRIAVLEGGGSIEEEDPVFMASEAHLFEAGDKSELDELTSGGVTSLHFHEYSGGGGSLGSFWVDGVLSSGINVTNPIIIPSDVTVNGDWVTYLEVLGDAVVDVILHRSGNADTSIFSSGIINNKPTFNGTESVVYSQPLLTEFVAGDILTLSIISCDGVASSLTCVPGIVFGSSGGIHAEEDPVFTASEAALFETGDKEKFNELTGYGETTLHTHPSASQYSINMYTAYDLPPETPSSMDDEFDSDTLSSLWTIRSGGTPNATWTPRVDALWVWQPAKAGWSIDSIMQAAPTGDFRVECAYECADALDVSYHVPAGLIISSAANTTSPLYAVVVRPYERNVGALYNNSYTSWGNDQVTIRNDRAYPQGYFAFEKLGTTWNFYFSFSGYNWKLVRTLTQPWAPVEVGVMLNGESSTYGLGAAWKWFRRVA